ncbi:MAG: DUF2961 domain-containing protein [Bryobacteraceae bacterium]
MMAIKRVVRWLWALATLAAASAAMAATQYVQPRVDANDYVVHKADMTTHTTVNFAWVNDQTTTTRALKSAAFTEKVDVLAGNALLATGQAIIDYLTDPVTGFHPLATTIMAARGISGTTATLSGTVTANGGVTGTTMTLSGVSTFGNTITASKGLSGTTATLSGDVILSALTASTVPYMNANKKFVSSSVTPTVLGFLSDVTSSIQAQLNGKSATDHNHDSTYLGIAAKAADADLLDGHDTGYFQTALTNPVTGTGSSGYVPMFTGTSTVGNSELSNNTTNHQFGLYDSTLKSRLNLNVCFDSSTGGDGIAFRHGYSASELYGVGICAARLVPGGTFADAMAFHSYGGYAWFAGSNSEFLRLTHEGNLGVGTAAPGAKLAVAGDQRLSGTLQSTAGRVYSIDSAKQFMTAYPRVGKPQCVQTDAINANGTILYLGAGNTGVAREFFTAYFGGGLEYGDMGDTVFIRIYVGAGNVSDFSNINQTYLLANIPLAMLYLYEHDNKTVAKNYDTEFLNIGVSSSNGGTLLCPSIQFKMPIPFSNGIVIQMTDSAGAPIGTHYTWASYELGQLPSGYYKNWRFRSAYSSGAISSTRTFLNVSSGSGALLGIWSSCTNAVTNDWPENNWSFWIDGDSQAGTATWAVSGWEDLFFNAFWGATVPGIYREYGLLKTDGSDGLSGYAYLHNKNIEWTSGIVGKFPYSGTEMTSFKVLTLYYGE